MGDEWTDADADTSGESIFAPLDMTPARRVVIERLVEETRAAADRRAITERVLATKVEVRRTHDGEWLATSDPAEGVQVGALGPTEAEALRRFEEALRRLAAALVSVLEESSVALGRGEGA